MKRLSNSAVLSELVNSAADNNQRYKTQRLKTVIDAKDEKIEALQNTLNEVLRENASLRETVLLLACNQNK